MPARLPLVPTIPNYRVGTSLSGFQYILDIRWNARDEAWYMDVRSEDETLLLAGMKIVLGSILGGRVVDQDFPPGIMVAYDLANTGTEAGIDDLGVRVVVDYYGFDEFE